MENSRTVSFGRAWERLETWMELHAPDDYRALQLPASSEAISAITNEEFPVCSELQELLRLHDGVVDIRGGADPGSFLPSGYGLYSARRMRAAHQRMVENVSWSIEDGTMDDVIGKSAHVKWVPFAGDVTGQELIIDHRPGSTYGSVMEYDESAGRYEPKWGTLAHFLNELTEALENTGRVGYLAPRLRGDSLSIEWYIP
ncbi:SMI1/KNR4 family protein [Streptomyces sp. NPDC005970]|uniref:SMI1/KNR4 family protein n=1 Tax=Streptomyces sp. NPDC005970 TaxID=3156723 RepID=UPI00340AD12F